MTSKIKYSRFSAILTAIVFLVFFIGCVVTFHEKTAFYALLSIYVILLFSGLFYGAGVIEANSEYVVMKSLLKSRKIPVRNIESIEVFKPTMGAIRIFASDGFMGYWGIFREGDVGRYYAFYGKASDCFLIRMSNGDKYVLGCENPEAMVDFIKSQI